MNVLEILLSKGIYVNDYPGLQVEGKELRFFFFRISDEHPVRAGRKFEQSFQIMMRVVGQFNAAAEADNSDRELRVFYADDAGHYIIGRIEREDSGSLTIGNEQLAIQGDLMFTLLLDRVYAAEGVEGVKKVRIAEVKNVHVAIEKFLALYELGWKGLFKQRNDTADIESIFRSFSPFKMPFLGKKETLKNPTLTIQLGIRNTSGDEFFKAAVMQSQALSLDEIFR
jgi:hypothetical protein